ncbi:beta-lactamase family protein [Glaciecola sp. XM2]|jgi:CubicO group peptidase (beta-lactamase class C family)|uniref:serine hydrolase domain-containing protein n=1 Tax=Glaciecola sp. XM2 TaxID=1914931 RepID=UPI001BDF07BC|nr:serine hydrolase domain-containing protein [Glaciecola sp. XM2]MBT1450160.1 beta-lactamase family protein [Glaciecola sp. XM2]
MHKWQKITLKIVLAISLTTTSIYFFAPWEYALYYMKPLPVTVEAEVQQATKNGLDGIIIYSQRASEPAHIYTSGWHNRAEQIPAYGSALFKIASIAKLYEAVAVAKLAAADQLDLDKTLADYLPDLAQRIEYADQITIRMMVMHRSGIPNFTDQDGFDWASSSLDTLALALDKPADFQPGTDYAYSNTNYLLLQILMSKTLGYDYTQYIENHILTPLKLHDTYFSIHEVDNTRLMSGYYVGYEDDLKHLDQGYVASAENVGRFIRALNDGTLLNKQEQAIYSSLYEYGHTGWVLGYSSIAKYHSDIDTVVVQFTNTTGDDRVMLTNIIYNRVLNILRNQS